MVCTACGQRGARRACPALKATICSVCCGTKRQSEIRCPSDCQYLATARAHPAAIVRRQQEDDLRAFLPTVRDLSEQQTECMSHVLAFLRDYRGDALLRTTDADVEAAAAALAATHETAARGLIYEQRPSSLPAQRLAADLKLLVSQIGGDRGSSLDGNLAAVFRAVERGAREARKTLAGGDTAYLALLRRLIVAAEPQRDGAPGTDLVHQTGSVLIRP
jgi:hypothetical protein